MVLDCTGNHPAKIHKNNAPSGPVLSMSGSSYFNITKQVAEWLSVVLGCKINSSTKNIVENLDKITLTDDMEVISFDVVSLCPNVPVDEAIEICSSLLYSWNHEKPSVDKETFIKLLTICSKDVIMLTNDGLYRQMNCLAMGSPSASMLANGLISSFDSTIRDVASIHGWYFTRNQKESDWTNTGKN